jgi:multidrug efflux pump subunit AcrB
MSDVGIAGRIARAFILSKITPLLVIASLLLGVMAVMLTPREEEPQIVVPMIDIVVGWPGAAAADVERLVTVPIERALREIPEVEYVYATSRPSGALVIARFYVSSDPERALVNINSKLGSAAATFPEGVMAPEVTPWSIDDVPIVAVTFSSGSIDSLTLRRLAAEIEEEVRSLPGVARTTMTGGLRREIGVALDPERLAARGLPPGAVAAALARAAMSLPAGTAGARGEETLLETGDLLHSADEVADVIVAAPGGRPVRVRDVAIVTDGPEEPRDYVLHARAGQPTVPAVTLSVAKTRGSNATDVAGAVLSRIEAVKGDLIPGEVEMTVTRNYGRTAAEKSNGLIEHLLVASISVILLIAAVLGWREGMVVGVAVPVTLALTLFIYYVMGYTLNRVTLFALIFAIGILVDDAIVVVENIHRHIRMKLHSTLEASVRAVDEVGNPTILATLPWLAA